MKIAIYGDSYGSMRPVNKTLNPKLPWFDLLMQYYEVTNYAVGGSSLYYSYQMFLEHKNKYDKNIILGSLPARLYAPNLTWHHINNSIIDFSNIWINHGLSKEEVNAFIVYYRYIYNKKEESHMRLLIEKELRTESNTLYISMPETLTIVSVKEREHFGYNSKCIDNMNCHISNDSNQVFLESIIKWLETGEFIFDINNYKLPNKQDKYMYYI